MNFADWSEALPYGLRIARKLARRCPLAIDVDSVVMEALWKAQTKGRELSPTYVSIRVQGAIRDEMRRVAEGERHNYQDSQSFVDVDDQGNLADAEWDPTEAIDRRRVVESLSPAGLYLVRELSHGKEQREIAQGLAVTPCRISQVLAHLKAKPARQFQLPGRVDFFGEMRRAHRAMVAEAHRRAKTVTGTAHLLGVSVSDASRWVSTSKLVLPQRFERYPALRARAQRLVTEAFRRSKGSPMTAARLLGTDQHTASNLGRKLAPELVQSNRRPDLTAGAVVDIRRRGWSMARAAKHFGVGESTIARRLRAVSLPDDVPRDVGKRRPDLSDEAFVALKNQGLTWREIAGRLDVSMATVSKRLARAKHGPGSPGLAKCGER